MATLLASLLEPGRPGAKWRRGVLFYLGLALVSLLAFVAIRHSGGATLGLVSGLAPCQARPAAVAGSAWQPGGAYADCPPYGDVIQAATEREKHPILNQVGT